MKKRRPKAYPRTLEEHLARTKVHARVMPPKVRIVIWTDEDPTLIHLLMRALVSYATWDAGDWECNFVNRKKKQRDFYCYNTYVLRPSQLEYVVDALVSQLKVKAKIEFYDEDDWSWKPA